MGRGGAGGGGLGGWGVGDRGFEGGELMRLSNFNEGAHRRVWKEGTKGGCGAHLEGLEGGLGVGGGWAFGLG